MLEADPIENASPAARRIINDVVVLVTIADALALSTQSFRLRSNIGSVSIFASTSSEFNQK